MSVEFGDNSVAPLTNGQRNFPQYTRPFYSWEAVARIYPNHLEVNRFMRQPKVDRASFGTREGRMHHAMCGCLPNGVSTPCICGTRPSERIASVCDASEQSRQFPPCPQPGLLWHFLGAISVACTTKSLRGQLRQFSTHG
jgi:hypothetical protein